MQAVPCCFRVTSLLAALAALPLCFVHLPYL